MAISRWFQTVLVGAIVVAGCARKTSGAPVTGDAGGTSVASVAALDGGVTSARGFGESCLEDVECAAGVCFHKRLKVPGAAPEHRGANEAVERDGYCSLRCRADADCPVPLTRGKCGARGMCKRSEG
jgi:hypothetical protein